MSETGVASSSGDVSGLTVTELRAALDARGLPSDGVKAELVLRLQESLAGPSQSFDAASAGLEPFNAHLEEAERLEYLALRKQHDELKELVEQWQATVTELESRPPELRVAAPAR